MPSGAKYIVKFEFGGLKATAPASGISTSTVASRAVVLVSVRGTWHVNENLKSESFIDTNYLLQFLVEILLKYKTLFYILVPNESV